MENGSSVNSGNFDTTELSFNPLGSYYLDIELWRRKMPLALLRNSAKRNGNRILEEL